MYGEEERMEPGEDKESIDRPSRVKLLTLLILILLILTPIILSVYLYYLPLNDVEVIVYGTSRETEESNSYILLKVNMTNKGSISHYVYLTGSVVFSTEPDMVYTKTSASNPPIDPGATDSNIRVRVFVPDEVFQDPYEASCSIMLPPPLNKYNTDGIVFFTVVWLVVIAAVSTSLVRSWRKER